jgi:TolB-like protein/class 3 adenylate cyclase/Tfp pilus assembly protein PilF
MADEGFKRKLTAILSADVIGYSRLMRDDEEATVRDIAAHRILISEIIQQHHGRVVDSPGDNILAEFASVVDAVNGAIKIQQEIKRTNADTPQDRRMEFRIGINLGDVIEEEERIYGDGVNIAARVEGLAAGGGIAISGIVYDSIKDKLSLGYHDLGEQEVKNIPEPVRIYQLLTEPADAGKLIGIEKRSSKAIWFGIAAAVVVVAFVLGIWQFYMRRPDIEPASMEKMAFPLPDKPSIAVLPFDNLSGDKEQDPIADGLTEDIITSLSRVPDLFVIARNSTFTYKGKPVKVQQVAEELGVRYVLEGSVQRSGDNLRITAQLIDALKGNHLWAHRFDRRAENLFAMQDEITREVLIELQVKLTAGDHARTVSRGTESLEAWLLRSQAYSLSLKYTQEHVLKARELYEKAAEIDPNFARAWAGIAWTYRIEARLGAWVMSRKEALAKALELAEHAIEIDPKEPICYTVMADIYLIKGEHDRALAHAEKAVDLAPNYSTPIGVLAWLSFWAGDFQRCVDAFAQAKRLNPHYPASYLGVQGVALLFLGRHDDATATLKEAIRRQPTLWMAHARLVATYTDSDRMEEAKSAAAELLETRPKFTVDSFMKTQPFKKKEHKEWFRGLLLKAGLPENPPLPLPDKPSIAVLPFENMSGDPEQQYFSDGITEQIITSISKVPYIFVIARQSSFAFRDKQMTVQHIAKELGVRYILEGSLQRSGDRIRINAQLIDAISGHHLWAENYDRKLDDIFAIQDDICKNIMVALQVKLTIGEMARIYADTVNTRAYEKYIQGLEHYWLRTKEGSRIAIKLFQEAIAIDSEYAGAYILLGFAYLDEVFFLLTKTPSESIAKAEAMVQKAATIEGFMARENNLLGLIYVVKKDYDKAIASAEKAIEQMPSNAGSYLTLGIALRSNGQYEESISSIKKALQLNPVRPVSYLTSLAWAYLGSQQYEKAIANLNETLERNPDDLFAYMGLTVAYWATGLEDQAKQAAKHILRINPKFTVSYYEKRPSHKDRAFTKQVYDAWRKAGLPE